MEHLPNYGLANTATAFATLGGGLFPLIFFAGMLLATAGNDQIIYPFLAVHAIWHIVGAFGFMTLWAFNHVRFSRLQDDVPETH